MEGEREGERGCETSWVRREGEGKERRREEKGGDERRMEEKKGRSHPRDITHRVSPPVSQSLMASLFLNLSIFVSLSLSLLFHLASNYSTCHCLYSTGLFQLSVESHHSSFCSIKPCVFIWWSVVTACPIWKKFCSMEHNDIRCN